MRRALPQPFKAVGLFDSIHWHLFEPINPEIAEKGKLVGLEVKSTIQIGKGGESHDGRSGWHMVACYRIDRGSCHIILVHIMCPVLNGHTHPQPDWTYVSVLRIIRTSSAKIPYGMIRDGQRKRRQDPWAVCYDARKGPH